MAEVPYWQRRRLEKLGIKTEDDRYVPPVKKPTEKEMKLFFNDMIMIAPERCENCGSDLYGTKAIHPRAHVCHILPKRFFYSVATNPLNVWFGCIDCHNEYDKSWMSAGQMPVWNILILPRYKQFMHSIHENEYKHLPINLLNLINDVGTH